MSKIDTNGQSLLNIYRVWIENNKIVMISIPHSNKEKELWFTAICHDGK